MSMSVACTSARVSTPVVRATPNRAAVVVNAKAGNWLPGWSSPAHLDGSLPGDYGFDPLGLVRSPARCTLLGLSQRVWAADTERQCSRALQHTAAWLPIPPLRSRVGGGMHVRSADSGTILQHYNVDLRKSWVATHSCAYALRALAQAHLARSCTRQYRTRDPPSDGQVPR